jgi:hypothetical protein
MSKSHNKKRNVGIIYELLLRSVSSSLINDNKLLAQQALDIIGKRFDKSTEIYKEFRLFNALAKSTVSNSAVTAAILTEAKHAARRCDYTKLNKEKSYLIRDINYNLKDSSFYYRRIPEYKIYATIQTLLNDWRQGDKANLSQTVQYESKVAEHLLTEKVDPLLEENVDSDVNSLVVNIMTEKINNRYKGQLNDEQKDVIRDYVFSLSSDKDEIILKKLQEIKSRTLLDLNSFRKMTDNSTILKKITEVKEKIINESFSEIDDDSVSRFLVLIQLRQELKEALNG